METVKHPIMPLIEEAVKYLEKNYIPGGIQLLGFNIFYGQMALRPFERMARPIILIKFKLQARNSVLQFIKDLGVDINFAKKRQVRTSNCNDLEFEAVANIEVFRKLMKFSRDNSHAVVDLLPDFYMPYYREAKKEIAFEPRTWRLIRKNVNDKRKSPKSLLPIEKRAMGLA